MWSRDGRDQCLDPQDCLQLPSWPMMLDKFSSFKASAFLPCFTSRVLGFSVETLQRVNLCGVRRKSDSVQLSSWGWFKLLESDAGQFILGVFRDSTVWKEASWCHPIPCAQGGIIT